MRTSTNRGLTAQIISAVHSDRSSCGSLSTVTRVARLVNGEMPSLIPAECQGCEASFLNSWRNHVIYASVPFRRTIGHVPSRVVCGAETAGTHFLLFPDCRGVFAG